MVTDKENKSREEVKNPSLTVADFNYELPEELIAQHPLADRDASRLMVVDPKTEDIRHRFFRDIVDEVQSGDVLVFNNSKVLPARLYGVKQDTGARIELLLTKRLGQYEWEAMARPAKRLKEGSVILFPKDTSLLQGDGSRTVDADTDETRAHLSPDVCAGSAVVTGVEPEGIRVVRFHIGPDFDRLSPGAMPCAEESSETGLQAGAMEEFLYQSGQMPLPPYIHEPLKEKDRYQTVYAQPLGSVAAPTAGLHFTEPLLDRLRKKGVELLFVTLHVGIGTFRPVSVEKVEEHQMHSETYLVDEDVAFAINKAKDEGRRVIAVGTTALRTLESAHADGRVVAGTGDTDIFIYPGYQFRVIDALITNFHLPKSTLIMLVSAIMGTEFTRRVYETAVSERYRFFSFGDAMFIKGVLRENDTTDSV